MCDVQNTDKEKHSHSHSHTQTKAVVNRLSRAIGHLESVKRMVEDGRESPYRSADTAFSSKIGNK